MKEIIESYEKAIEIGTKLLTKIAKKYTQPSLIKKAALLLKIPFEANQCILDNEMEKIYLLDFAFNDIYVLLPSDKKSSNNQNNVDPKPLKTNVIERYKIVVRSNDNYEEKILNSMIESRLSIFEVVDIKSPMVALIDLLDNDKPTTIIDKNGSKTFTIGMILGARIKHIDQFWSTNGANFVFSGDDKSYILQNWRKTSKKVINKPKNTILFPFLFRLQREIGIPVTSEIFLK